MGGDGKGQAQVHAAGIALDGGIDKFLNLGKSYDLVKFLIDFNALHAQDRTVQVNIFTPAEFGMKAGANFEQRADPPVDFRHSRGRFGNTRKNLEQGALTGSVAPDNSQHLPLAHFKRYIFQCPNKRFLAVFLRRFFSAAQRRLNRFCQRLSQRAVILTPPAAYDAPQAVVFT